MNDVTAGRRRAAAALVADLEGLLAALAQTDAETGVSWLRPLALLSAEIEYSALRRTEIDAASLALALVGAIDGSLVFRALW